MGAICAGAPRANRCEPTRAASRGARAAVVVFICPIIFIPPWSARTHDAPRAGAATGTQLRCLALLRDVLMCSAAARRSMVSALILAVVVVAGSATTHDQLRVGGDRGAGGPARAAGGPPPACPVVGGVVDASRCAGWSADDATSALQHAFQSGAHTILIRNLGTPWLLNTTLYLGSNQTVKLSPGTIIEAKRWAPFWNDSQPVKRPKPLVSTGRTGSFNVTIQGAAGAVVRMHKQDYMNPKLYPIHNEWRYGLYLSSGSQHIQVYDLTISAAGGDGICIAHAASDIRLARLVLDNNYRNALTITNGKDLLVEDCVFSNTSGTDPSAGVDIEPDSAWSDLSNITFRRCQFLHNWGAGFSMAPGHIKPWNRTQYPGVPQCARAHNNSACPISVSIEESHFEGTGGKHTPCASPCPVATPSGSPPAADCPFFDCGTRGGEQFGILFAGVHTGVPGTFRVSDTTIANTALSGLFISEKPASGALLVVSNVTLNNTAANLTGYQNWIWKTGWLNSPVVIQNDSPATFGSAGGMVLEGLTIINDHPRPWLTTYVDPTTRLQSIAGAVKVVTRKEFAGLACALNPGKPSDSHDVLLAVTVTCA